MIINFSTTMKTNPQILLRVCLAVTGSLTLSLIAQTQDAQPRAVGPAQGGAGGARGGFGAGSVLAAQMLSQGDKNADQKLSKEEMSALADAWFDKLDPDKTGKLSQEQFTLKFADVLPPPQGRQSVPGGGAPRGGRGGFGPARFVGPGLFTAADANKDGLLIRAELKATFERWFDEWDKEKSGAINQETLVAGLNAALPRPNFGGQPVTLGPDDRPAFPAAPAGFDSRRENIARGKIETVKYDSKTVGVERKMVIYTPPGYSKDAKYPVLYLLHGIGDDEMGWQQKGSADVILDGLYTDKKPVPMIVVMPNGRAAAQDRATGNFQGQFGAFETFEQDLLKDIIPYVESRYSVKADREYRALAGLSMGGGQSLNFGLKHLDTFAWVGGFSSAPNTKPAAELITDPADTAKKLKLLWVSCGDQDGLMNVSKNFHVTLKEKSVPHIWHVDSGRHEWPVWKNDLYLLATLLFR